MARRLVVLVTGPPCAGKSTLVQSSRGPDDVVADFDAIAQGLASHPKWAHDAATGDAAERVMWGLIEQVAQSDAGTSWVIRSVPDADERAALAETLHADRVLVLLPSLGELLLRARERPLAEQTRKAIWRWRDLYSPSPSDEVVRDPSLVEF